MTTEMNNHENEWHSLNPEQVLSHFKVQDNGLTTEQAKERLSQYGPNQLKEAPRPTFLQMLWDQLNNFVVILLIVASVISALLGDYVEAAAIMAIVVLNAISPGTSSYDGTVFLCPSRITCASGAANFLRAANASSARLS